MNDWTTELGTTKFLSNTYNLFWNSGLEVMPTSTLLCGQVLLYGGLVKADAK